MEVKIFLSKTNRCNSIYIFYCLTIEFTIVPSVNNIIYLFIRINLYVCGFSIQECFKKLAINNLRNGHKYSKCYILGLYLLSNIYRPDNFRMVSHYDFNHHMLLGLLVLDLY